MRGHVIDISTEVYRLLQERTRGLASWTDEKPGPMQQIVLDDEAYRKLVDRAIAEQKTLDRVICDTCVRN